MRRFLLLCGCLLLAGCASGTNDTPSVTLFYTHDDAPAGEECDDLVPVTVPVPRDELTGTGMSAKLLGRLFAGVPAHAGPRVTTQIPAGTVLRDMTLSGGILDVDIRLGAPVAGSCRVTAIRKQIIGTLNANGMYPEIRILVDGRADGLEP
jgi:hypothetical protein